MEGKKFCIGGKKFLYGGQILSIFVWGSNFGQYCMGGKILFYGGQILLNGGQILYGGSNFGHLSCVGVKF